MDPCEKIKIISIVFFFFIVVVIVPASPATKVAVIQYEIKDPDKVGIDADLLEKYIREAALKGARLIVTPETAFYRYEPWLQSGTSMLDLAMKYDELKDRFSLLADELEVSLVIGLREPSGDKEKPVYNTALFFGPDGSVLGKQHKIITSNSEMAWTKAGNSSDPFETPIGRVGMMICKTAKTNWWNSFEKEDNLDLIIVIAGDKDGKSFDKFSTICNKSNCYGILANQIAGEAEGGRKGNSAWGYPDGKADFLGGGEQIFYIDLPLPIKNEFKPQSGQIMVDPDNSRWLVYNRDYNFDGSPDSFFLCGPGDPENFLYRGTRNPDGTRDGDQLTLIEKLKAHGGNCIYLMAVRTHGGDAWKDVEDDPGNFPDDKHNPWVLQDPAFGLNPDILCQWENWFSEMDESGITVFLFLYDDAINVGQKFGWALDASGNLHPAERQFIQDIVNKFEHHKNLVWCMMEEGQEVGQEWQLHISKMAEAIREADDYYHVIASHQLPGNVFYHAEDPNIDQFAIQTALWEAGTTPDSIHNWLLKAWDQADGKFNLNMSEDQVHYESVKAADREAVRTRSWAIAMAGCYIMVLGMDIADTPAELLHDCRNLQVFFESTDFNTMAPHDELKFAGTQYILADPGRSYIAYSALDPEEIGIRNMPEGAFNILWFDCISGITVENKHVYVKKGNCSWKKPDIIGSEVAFFITRADKDLQKKSSQFTPNDQSRKGSPESRKNRVPESPEKSVSTAKNRSVDIQLSYFDPDGGPGPYSTVVLSPPLHGQLTGVGNDITYTPAKDFTGNDWFTWKVNDGAGDSGIAIVRISVIP